MHRRKSKVRIIHNSRLPRSPKMIQDPIHLQPIRSRHITHHSSIATPLPIQQIDTIPTRIGFVHYIPNQFKQITLFLHKICLITPLKNMANTTMPPIRLLRKHTIKLAHSLWQIPITRLNNKRVMVVHQTPAWHRQLNREQTSENTANPIKRSSSSKSMSSRRSP